ncbi:MAG: hypothetical protein V1897_17400 [Pseudomonadota bacterium]
MRRGLILFVGILALALAPTFVGAQYSGAFGLSGLPSMPSMFGGSGKCGDAASPGIAPAFYVGWGIPQERNTSVSLTAQHLGASNVRSVDIKFPTNGLWLGAALPISLTESSQCGGSASLSFVATGWYLFGGDGNADSWDDYTIPGLAGYSNDWSAKHNWWFVDGALAYGWSGFAALVGLRYDNYTASFTSPNNFGLFTGREGTNFLSSAWIPFIGFQSAYTDSNQSLKVRMLGIPTIVGYSYVGLTVTGAQRFEYNNPNYTAGHFFEVFGEYTRKFFGASQAGVFLRWNSARATSSGTGEILNTAFQDTYNFSLNRSSWTLGGLVTLDFNTPF